jgi:hypothetical protein
MILVIVLSILVTLRYAIGCISSLYVQSYGAWGDFLTHNRLLGVGFNILEVSLQNFGKPLTGTEESKLHRRLAVAIDFRLDAGSTG